MVSEQLYIVAATKWLEWWLSVPWGSGVRLVLVLCIWLFEYCNCHLLLGILVFYQNCRDLLLLLESLDWLLWLHLCWCGFWTFGSTTRIWYLIYTTITVVFCWLSGFDRYFCFGILLYWITIGSCWFIISGVIKWSLEITVNICFGLVCFWWWLFILIGLWVILYVKFY